MRALDRRLSVGLILSATLATIGCQTRLDVERTVTVDPAVVKTLEFDAPRYDQKVTMTLSSPDAPVNAYVCLSKDSDEVAKAVEANKSSDKILAKQEKTQDASLQVTVPAKNSLSVILTCATAKASPVKLKVKGG